MDKPTRRTVAAYRCVVASTIVWVGLLAVLLSTDRLPAGGDATLATWVAAALVLCAELLVALVLVGRATKTSAALDHEAQHDPLTGLANRRRFERLAAAALAGTDPRVGLLLVDLDRFKQVNDTLGHPVGDVVLRAVAGRLSGVVRGRDTAARLGGDEFAVLLPSLPDPAVCERLARRILAAFDQPVEVDGLALDVGASIGIATSPEHGTDAEQLVAHADVALYRAKAARGTYAISQPWRDDHAAGTGRDQSTRAA